MDRRRVLSTLHCSLKKYVPQQPIRDFITSSISELSQDHLPLIDYLQLHPQENIEACLIFSRVVSLRNCT